MERQSTSKLFKIVIAIVAFFVLCSSALLFASCGVSKDDGHEHKYPDTPNATVPATCGTPGYIVYECTECGEQFKVEISLATGKHTFNENDVCTNCGMTKTQADLLTQAAFKSAIDDLKNTLGTLATGAQLQGLNDLSQAQVKTLTDALETALKAAITNAQTAITEAVGGSTSAGSAGTDSAKEAILQAIQEALKAINGEDATSVQSVLKAEIAKQTAKIEEYNTDLKNLKTALEAAQGEAKDAIIEKINKTNEAIESAKDAIVAAVSVAQTSIEGKLDDLDEKVGTAQTTLSGEIGNVKTVVDGIQEALKALDNLAKTTDVGEVKTLVEDIKTTLTKTIAGRFDSIDGAIAALTNSESGIAASVKSNTQTQLEALKSELVTLITTETSNDKFNAVVSKITKEITDAFGSFEQTMNDTLEQQLEGILTQSHFDTELQKVTETLGKIESKVNEALDKKLSEVEGSIGTAQKAILDAIAKMAGSEEEGEGPVLPTIKGWVQEILYAITGDSQYAPAAGASLMSESVKPEGMQKQIADLWDKAVELQDALTTLSGSLTTLSDSVSNLPNKTEVQGYFAQLKTDLEKEQTTYASNLTTLNSTLSSVSTKVDNVQSYLEETLYVKLGQMDEKLTTLVQNMGEFYTLFTKLRTYAQEHYADLGGKTWEEVFDNVLSTFGGYFQQLPSYLNKLKGWDDIIDKIVEFAKAQGVVNEDGTLGTNFNKAIDTVKALWDFLGVSEQLDDNGDYKNDGAITTVATLVGMLEQITSTTDGIKETVDNLAAKFADIDKATLEAALNALTADDKSEGTLSGLADALAQLQNSLSGIPTDVLDKEGVQAAIIELISNPQLQDALIAKLKELIKTYTGMEAGDLKDLVNTYLEYAKQLQGIFGDGHGIEQLKALANWAFEERHNLKDLVEAGTQLKEFLGEGEQGFKATIDALEQSIGDKLGDFSADSTLKDYLDSVFGGSSDVGAHQHNWVLVLVKQENGLYVWDVNGKPLCVTDENGKNYNEYAYRCSICGQGVHETITADDVKNVYVQGHVTDWTYFGAEKATFGKGDAIQTTYYAPTCVNPGRVEGYCVVCGQPTGEWTTVGAPTGIHNYVLETAHKAEGEGCTFVHDYVYHCTTCGGAYTEKVTGEGFFDPDAVHGSEKTPHNYYTLTIEEQNDLFDAYVEQYNKDHSDETITVEDLTAQQKYELLEPYLNKVWDHEPTCVEPSLTVVECTVCGVRYAYSGLEPNGHTFEVVSLGTQNTCTMDGSKPYFKCTTCGYFFEYDAPAKADLSPVEQETTITEDDFKAWAAERTNQFSKNYAKDTAGNVLTDDEAAAQYFTGLLKATGHNYVKVYTNVPDCVTAATYVLVCQTCFKVDGKSIAIRDPEDPEGKKVVVDPEGLVLNAEKSNDGVAKFEKVPADGYYTEDAYLVRGLTGDHEADAEKVRELFDNNGSTGEPKDGESTLTKEYNKLAKEGANDVNALLDFLVEYGYITDDEKAAFVEAETTVEAIDKLNLYTAKNFLERVTFKDEVHGHTFNDVVTTVVGVCVMYPRHQYFCSVCGQDAVDPSFTTSAGDTEVPKLGNAKVPYFVEGATDSYVAYGKEEQETDLGRAWQEVSAKGEDGLDDILNWLGKYGYLNDFRESIATPWNETELATVKANLGKHYGEDSENPATVTLANINEWKLFTGENVLNEYIDNKDKKGDVKPIGHTFDLAIQLDTESCNEPGRYVYICSVCGMVKAWEKGDTSEHSSTKQPSWWKGQNTVDTLLKELTSNNSYISYTIGTEKVTTKVTLLPNALDKNNEWHGSDVGFYYLYDAALDGSNKAMTANIPTGRTDITESDLVASWNAVKDSGDEAIFNWLYDYGYLNNVKDTVIENMRAQLAEADVEKTQKPQKLYDLAYAWFNGDETIDGDVNVIDAMKAILGEAGNDLKLLTEETSKSAVNALLKGEDGILKKCNIALSVFYTKAGLKEYSHPAMPSNSTYNGAATPIPVSGHLYADSDGRPFTKGINPDCEGFANKTLTDLCKAGKFAYWDSATETWKEVEGASFEYSEKTLGKELYEQIEKYGVVAACKREKCPFHVSQDSYKGDEPFTAGYIAAQPHEKHWYKYLADENGARPSGTFEVDMSTYYVLEAEDSEYYKDLAAEDTEGKTAKELFANDESNLYILQALFEGKYAEKYGPDTEYKGNLTKETVPAFEDGDWQPMTDADTPSCWLSYRCKWHHYTVEDDKFYDGTRCDEELNEQPHTNPDKDHVSYQGNCQHGDKCVVCGKVIGNKGNHNLIDVTRILNAPASGADSDLRQYQNALKALLENEAENGMTYHEAGCLKDGQQLMVCIGDLEVYLQEGKVNDGIKWEKNVNWTTNKIDKVPHQWLLTTYYTDDTNERILYNSYEDVEYVREEGTGRIIKVTGTEVWKDDAGNVVEDPDAWLETWKVTYNAQLEGANICKRGYYKVDTCIFDPSCDDEDICQNGASDAAEYWCNHSVRIETEEVKNGKGASGKPVTDQLGHYGHVTSPGHVFAPVKGYWEGEYKQYYVKANQPGTKTDGRSAWVMHVCVICGENRQGIYGENTRVDGSLQYTIANSDQIAAWNASHPANKPDAQLIRGIDDINSTQLGEGETGIEPDEDGVNWLEPNVTLTEDVEWSEEFKAKKGSVVDLNNHTLTFKNGMDLEVSGEGRITFKNGDIKLADDFTDVFNIDGGDVYEFDNVTFTLDSSKSAGSGKYQCLHVDWSATLIIRNSTIYNQGFEAPIMANGPFAKVEIENSVIASDGVGFVMTAKNGSLTAINTTFYGKMIGALIRSGNKGVNLTGCKFYTGATKYSSIPGAWGGNANAPVQAALVLGNGGAYDFRDVDATLKNCTFGFVTEKDGDYTVAAIPAEDNTNAKLLALYAYGQKKDIVTNVTMDLATSLACAGSMSQTEAQKGKINLIIDTNGATAEEAASLIKSVENGGTIVLPESQKVTLSDKLNVTEGKDVTIVLSGSQLTLDKGAEVAGNLTIEGGDLVVKNRESANNGFAVTGSLKLSGVDLSVTESGCDYAVYAKVNSTVTVENSVLYSSVGQTIGTNNLGSANATLVLIDSAFINDAANGDGQFGMLVNNGTAKVYAGGCTFYGTNGAVWVRAAGTAVFMGCTFISGGVASTYEAWDQGTQIPTSALAAVVVGNGGYSTNYDPANAEFTDCTVVYKLATVEGESLKGQGEPTQVETKRVYTYKDGKLTPTEESKDVASYTGGVAPIAEAPVAGKAFMMAAYNTSKVTVKFGDANTAKLFLGKTTVSETVEDKVVTKEVPAQPTTGGEHYNVVLGGTAFGSNFTVTYQPEEEGAEPVELTVKEVIGGADDAAIKTNLAAAVANATKNGGDIVLPSATQDSKPVELDAQVKVESGKAVEFELNGNTLSLTDTVNNTQVQGELKISGGTVTVPKVQNGKFSGIGVNGEGAKLTLENTTVISESSIQPAHGGTLVIKDSFIRSNNSMAISTNNLEVEPDATIEITNSTIASMDQTDGTHTGNGGNVGLMVNNEKVTVTATDSTFYGVCTGAWVRGGEATFEKCTFISGSAKLGTKWDQGTYSPSDAKAALLVGNGGYSTNYGSATVTLKECNCIVSKEVVARGEDGIYTVTDGNLVKVNDTAANNAKIEATNYDGSGKDTFVAKKLVLAAYSSTTTITLDDTSAKNFGVDGEGAFVKGTNVLSQDDAFTGESFIVNGQPLSFN